MKFSYAIGNPPYQETKGGTKNVDIWPEFVKESTRIADKSCMIHPGRWILPTATRFNMRDTIVNNSLKSFDYYPKSDDLFSGTQIAGGISITFFETNFNDNIKYKVNGSDMGIYTTDTKIFCDNYEQEAYLKVFNNISTDDNMNLYVTGGIGALSAVNTEQIKYLSDNPDNMEEPIKIWTSVTVGKHESHYNWYYIDKCNLKNVNEIILSTRKVMLDKKGGALANNRKNVINGLPQICDKNCTGDNVLWVFPNKITDRQTDRQTDRYLLLLKSLFMTKTARYLMCITQKSLYVRGFENIPDYIELAKLLPDDELFTDEWFYKTFDFSKGLINEIETRVSPKVEK